MVNNWHLKWEKLYWCRNEDIFSNVLPISVRRLTFVNNDFMSEMVLIDLFALSSLCHVNNPVKLGTLLFSFYWANENDKMWRTTLRQTVLSSWYEISQLTPEVNMFWNHSVPNMTSKFNCWEFSGLIEI